MVYAMIIINNDQVEWYLREYIMGSGLETNIQWIGAFKETFELVFPILILYSYRKAIDLQRWTPMHYMSGHGHAYT